MLTRFFTTLALCLLTLTTHAQSIENEAVDWLQVFIQVDTINPPGNETRAIEAVTAERHPGSRVLPAVATGFTDSHFTRDLGIASYGFDPIVIPESEWDGIHGNNERISLAAFKRGVSDHLAIIRAVVYD